MRKSIGIIIIFFLSLLMGHPTRAVATTPKDDCKRSRKSAIQNRDIHPDPMPQQAVKNRALGNQMPGTFGAGDTQNVASHEGIDVSHYQGRIDWERVGREGGISYVYCKATEGANYADDTHAYNISMAHKYGLKVGSYHYYRPTVNADLQLANLTKHVRAEEQDLVPMIDVEEDRGVTEEQFIADLTEFVRKVERHYGRKPLLYSGEYFYNRHFQGMFQEYEWMIARYSTSQPALKDGKQYLMWQYSDKGRIPGINGMVDRSRIMGNGKLQNARMR